MSGDQNPVGAAPRRDPEPLGVTLDTDGALFRVFAGRAERVELCLFDARRRETRRLDLQAGADGAWSAFLPGCAAGQRYGYRAHGPWVPRAGLRFNPAKLLLDPYARALDGGFRWSPALYDFAGEDPFGAPSTLDSAPDVALSVVAGALRPARAARPIPWTETILYEANVRGYTMRHPEIPDLHRGRFAGMKHGAVLGHLKALGVTSIELMPVHALLDEAFLVARGQRNLWGYNSIQFFVPDARFALADPRAEFLDMVDAIHDAGLEVILDVVYNHTAEGDEFGPSLCFRGLDNPAYYRMEASDPGRYVNDTGCGNTINADHPRVQDLVLDSLAFWRRDMGVDGFRFDLATVLGRHARGFAGDHPLLQRIASDLRLAGTKRIAEPWDPGPGGYQLGAFPAPFAELNDRFRDTVRRFWRGDPGQMGELAMRLHGSADLFEAGGRPPAASVNMVTNHDGFTLADLVCYEGRQNAANGHGNHDGHTHNYSANYGCEGPSDDPAICDLRCRQRLNLLATLLFSQGTPLLLGGDEFGNSQQGNNNAYAQDNEIGWLDWSGLVAEPEFTAQVRRLIALRRRLGLLRRADYVHHEGEIQWLRADGRSMEAPDWRDAGAKLLLHRDGPEALAILINGSMQPVDFRLPQALAPAGWHCLFTTGEAAPESPGEAFRLTGPGLALLGQLT